MATEEKKPEEELVVVGPGADLNETVVSEEDEQESPNRSETATEESDERAGHSEEEDGERTAIRQRRREEKVRKREQRQRDLTELRFLRSRNDALEKRQSQIEARQTQNESFALDSRINELDQQIRQAEDIHAAAVAKGAGEEATEALRIRDQLRDGATQLRNAKAQQSRQAERPNTSPPPDPAIVSKAQEWMRDNSDWFDPTLRNEDSMIAKVIEDNLYREGRLDARTDAYWEEYERRLAKRLPHVFSKDKRVNDDTDDDDDVGEEKPSRVNGDKRAGRGGPRITTGGRERPLKKNEVYVSAERKAAMVEAGVWDDPQLRARYLKKYQDYDREHGIRRH